MQKFFVEQDEDGKWTRQYDRKKRFGEILNDEQLVYEPPEELEEAIEALYNVNEAIEHEPQNIEHVKMKVMLTSKIAELEAKGMTPGGGLGKITSSYQLNLPPEYYMKQIQKAMPDEEEKWFIRPHHIESLTNHARSIKDDFMNTNYYSYYDKIKTDETESQRQIRVKIECLKKLKDYIEDLKHRQ